VAGLFEVVFSGIEVGGRMIVFGVCFDLAKEPHVSRAYDYLTLRRSYSE